MNVSRLKSAQKIADILESTISYGGSDPGQEGQDPEKPLVQVNFPCQPVATPASILSPLFIFQPCLVSARKCRSVGRVAAPLTTIFVYLIDVSIVFLKIGLNSLDSFRLTAIN